METILRKKPEWAQIRDYNGWLVWHELVLFGHLESARLFIEVAKVDVNVRTGNPTQDGGNALFWATRRLSTNHPLIDYLVSKGGRIIAPGESLNDRSEL